MMFVLKRYAKTISLVLLMVFLWVLLFVGWSQRVALADWWRLRDYTPSQEIAALANDTAMTEQARRLFYVYDPKLESAENFNQHCRINEFTIVLGCYVSGSGIHIYNVDDDRLMGVEEVTAAHEMLHVAYERLSSSERSRINDLLLQAFKDVSDERIQRNIEQYRQADPSVVPNELHSILGTEVRLLPTDLEVYYAQYFSDRGQVVNLAEDYEAAFTERQNSIDQLKQELETRRDSIARETSRLQSESESLASEFRALSQARTSTDPVAFNQRADAYNARVDAYNRAARALTANIERFNVLVSSYNELVVESQDLFKAIDSRPAELDTQ